MVDKTNLIWINYSSKDTDNGQEIEPQTPEPVLINIEQNSFPKKLKDEMTSMNKGEEREVNVDKPYGRKDPARVRIVSEKMFKKSKIQPYPGLVVNLDGLQAIIRTVNGGRVMIDFNHPLAGKNITYKVKIEDVAETEEEKVGAICKSFELELQSCDIIENKATLNVKKINEKEFDKKIQAIETTILRFIPYIKKIEVKQFE